MTIYVYLDSSETIYYREKYALRPESVKELRDSWSPEDGDFIDYIKDAVYDDINEWCDYIEKDAVDSDNYETDDMDTSEINDLEDLYPEYFPNSDSPSDEKYVGEF